MKGILVIVGITALVAVSSIISSVGKLVDRRRKGIKIVTGRGWTIIALNLGILILSVLQYTFNESELVEKEKSAVRLQESRDSILKANYDSSLLVLKSKFDTSNLNTVLTISQTLGEYGYKFDSAQKKLERIVKDSAKTRIYTQEDPVLTICEIVDTTTKKKSGYNSDLLVKYCSIGAGSTDFKITSIIALADTFPTKNYKYVGKGSGLAQQLQIPKEMTYSRPFYITSNQFYMYIYIYLTGTYSNIDRTKTFKVDALYFFNKIGRNSGLVDGDTREEIIQFLKNR
jgi:hypothetical protein